MEGGNVAARIRSNVRRAVTNLQRIAVGLEKRELVGFRVGGNLAHHGCTVHVLNVRCRDRVRVRQTIVVNVSDTDVGAIKRIGSVGWKLRASRSIIRVAARLAFC